MGVAGLWDVLKPAAKTRSLTELAVTEGFLANPLGLRGYRVGIDASIWFFHAEYGKEGENPVLRTLFFRCATLMKAPFLPLFVFDGPKRPEFKRGKRINKTGSKLIPGMKRIVEAFGFEWRTAPGEAEAELAYLNRIGVIDGILSDDVDNFLFGAMTVIRNQSNNLSGNKANPVLNSEGRDDKNHTRVFRFQDIRNHPDIQLTRGGLILIGLLSGGDYEGGLERCGIATAHALARCGFGDSLYEAARDSSRDELVAFLDNWRQEVRHELKTNSRGFMARKSITLSNSVPDTFPNIDVLLSYVQPITSESLGHDGANPKITWSKEPNVAALAAACELFFEWGYREAIIKRFRTVVWPGVVLRILRRAVLDVDGLSSFPSTPHKSCRGFSDEEEGYGTPSKMISKHFSALQLDDDPSLDDNGERLIVNISRERTHASADGLPEYRLEIAPAQLVQIAESGIQGLRQPEGPNEWASDLDDNDEDDESGRSKAGKRKGIVDPTSHLRLWMPTCMVDIVEKKLVKDFRDAQERKKQRKRASAKRRAVPREAQSDLQSPKRSSKAASSVARVASLASPQAKTLDELPLTPPKMTPHPVSSEIDVRKKEEEESSGDEGELPVVPFPKRATTVPVRKPLALSTKAFKRNNAAAIFEPSPFSSSLPSPKSIENALALSGSEEELPANVYRTTQPKSTKQATSTIQGYISLSDDDNSSAKPNTFNKHTKATNKKQQVTQTTLSSYVERDRRRKLSGSRDETRDVRERHKSPRKSKAHISPRHKGPAVAKKLVSSKNDDSIIVVSDEDSDAGYSGISRPNIAPLQLARARVKERAMSSLSQLNSTSVGHDVIDLT